MRTLVKSRQHCRCQPDAWGRHVWPRFYCKCVGIKQ